MSKSRRVLLLALPLLWCAVLVSSAAAIYSKYHARELFVELEGLNAKRDGLDAEWDGCSSNRARGRPMASSSTSPANGCT